MVSLRRGRESSAALTRISYTLGWNSCSGLRLIRFVAIVLLIVLSFPASRAETNFSACLVDLQAQARERGLPARIVDEVLGGLSQQPRVIELDRAQPEFRQSFAAYMRSRVNQARIWRGRLALVEQAELLVRLTEEYGVPGHYLVAFWGLETNYGGFLGRMPTLDVLATLACDPRRSAMFTEQLMTALELVERDALRPDAMRGSWAGAMGHTQFMPSTWRDHAIDGDGDGRIDLWGSEADALASAAHYLRGLGWRSGERWGREVRLPQDFDYALSGLDGRKPLAEWIRLGVLQSDGRPLQDADMEAALLVPMGHRGPAFLVYENFEVIMRWNRSQAYALSVGHLADRIVGAPDLVQPWPDIDRAPSADRMLALQHRLQELGHEPGEPDGVLGPATRAALREFQAARGLIADGYPDETAFEALGLGVALDPSVNDPNKDGPNEP